MGRAILTGYHAGQWIARPPLAMRPPSAGSASSRYRTVATHAPGASAHEKASPVQPVYRVSHRVTMRSSSFHGHRAGGGLANPPIPATSPPPSASYRSAALKRAFRHTASLRRLYHLSSRRCRRRQALQAASAARHDGPPCKGHLKADR
jgi:hypothetical protein